MRQDGKLPCSNRGFGLLEAIVALTLLAGSGAALFAWIAQSTQAAARLEDAQARASLQILAQGLMTSVNPFQEPQGERRVGDIVVSWKAQPQAPMRLSLPTVPGQPLRWRVGLYRVEVRARKQDESLDTTFEMSMTGLEDLARGGAAALRSAPP